MEGVNTQLFVASSFIWTHSSTYFDVFSVVTRRVVTNMERDADVQLTNFLKTNIVANFRQNPRFTGELENLYSPIYYSGVIFAPNLGHVGL